MNEIPTIKLPDLHSGPGRNRKVVRSMSRIEFTVYPHEEDPVFPNRSADAIPMTWDAGKSMASVQTLRYQKTLGAGAAQWAIVIKEHARSRLYLDNGSILTGDWASLVINRNGLQIPLFLGPIDTVVEDTTGTGATIRTWTITGRDHGALFEYPIMWNNIYMQSLKQITGGLYYSRMKGASGGDPAKMFGLLIGAAFEHGSMSQQSEWQLPESLYLASKKADYAFVGFTGTPTFHDILWVRNQTPTRGIYHNDLALWTNPGDGLHSAIGKWCNPLLNEYIYDLQFADTYQDTGKADASPAATIREHPFPFVSEELEYGSNPVNRIRSGIVGSWFSLPTWEIPNWLPRQASVGRSQGERYNAFEIVADIGISTDKTDQQALAPPSWDVGSIAKHGVRPFLQSTNGYVPTDEEALNPKAWIEHRIRWQKLQVEWFCLNPYFDTGTISIPLPLPEIRIGQRIVMSSGKYSDRRQFYNEGVVIDYNVGTDTSPGKWNTTWSVTRGWRGLDTDLIKAIRNVSREYETGF